MGVFFREDWTGELVYLVSVCKRGLVLVLVLDWTLPKKAGGWGLRRRKDKVDTICTVPLECGTPTTRMLYPCGANNHSHTSHQHKRYHK